MLILLRAIYVLQELMQQTKENIQKTNKQTKENISHM